MSRFLRDDGQGQGRAGLILLHVGLHLPNTPHFVIGFFAVLMAGGRVVNFSPLAAPRELQYQLADSEAQVMITLGLPMLYPQIAVEYSDLSTAELYNRVISEKAAGQSSADFVWTSGMDTGMRLVADGYAATYASPEIANLPKWAVWKVGPTTTSPSRSRPGNCWRASRRCCGARPRRARPTSSRPTG